MVKAIDAFRTISEVADEIGIPKHVLRFWEVKFPQVRPMKRGGGRRFYRPEDLELLKGICQLLHNEGYTIKGVQKILRRDGVEAVKAFGIEPQSRKAAQVDSEKSRPQISKQKISVSPDQVRPKGTGKGARLRSQIPPTARQTIGSVLDELASLKAFLAEDKILPVPSRVRGVA